MTELQVFDNGGVRVTGLSANAGALLMNSTFLATSSAYVQCLPLFLQ